MELRRTSCKIIGITAAHEKKCMINVTDALPHQFLSPPLALMGRA